MWLEPLTDAWSPHEVALRLADCPGIAWLDGGLSHGREGRYSFVACHPNRVVRAFAADPQPLAVLAEFEQQIDADGDVRGPLCAEDVPRWVGVIGYDAHPIERARFLHPRNLRTPCLRFARYDALYAFDHAEQRSYLVGDDREACARLGRRLEGAGVEPDLKFAVSDITATPSEAHAAAILRALTHIRDGDVYQINVARRWAGRFTGSPLGLFLRMRAESPVPLGFFAQAEDHAVLGRSMERFLRYRRRDRSLWTSPIKGTIARHGDDAGEARSLRSDDKEHAEHAMVIDLMRNDLSRVSVSGSVEVQDAFTVLPFAGLSHLISTVVGRAQPELTLASLIARTFPPGSVTGTPKERAMTLIEELEPRARGLYTGAYGFVDRAGGISLSVAIRTALVAEGEVEYWAGGGIVWGSDPERECAETELKARVFLNAVR